MIGPHGSIILKPARFTGEQPFCGVSSPLRRIASFRVTMEVPPRIPRWRLEL